MKKQMFILMICILIGGMTACEKALKEYNEPTGAISGKVVDPSGVGLENVFVVFEHAENGALHGTMSRNDGSFFFGALSTGEYKIFGVQDTLMMGEDTLRVFVNNGQEVVIRENLVMKIAGVPMPALPEVVSVTSSSVTLKVAYQTFGSAVSGYGFFYTQDGTEPSISSNRKAASSYYDTITKDYYMVTFSGLLADKTYRFKSYLAVKNTTPYYSTVVGDYVMLSESDLEVTTLPINR